MNASQAFLSYTRIDDEFFGGAITALRRYVELGVRVFSGDPNFSVFQDIDGIELGQQFELRINEAISQTTFLVPVLTPSFFRSEACRDELSKFLHHERCLGRADLILPIYFVTVPSLEKTERPEADSLAIEIKKRQRFDWRSRAYLPLTEIQVKQAANELCEKVAAAIQRTQGSFFLGPAKSEIGAVSEHRLSDAAQDVRQKRQDSQLRTTRPRILWVDDRPDNNVFERRAFEEYGVDFELATSTIEALGILSRARFDAIISDMGRPPDDSAGYTLLEIIRNGGNDVPYFIYAGSRNPTHVAEALRRGAQGTTNRAEELVAMVVANFEVNRNGWRLGR